MRPEENDEPNGKTKMEQSAGRSVHRRHGFLFIGVPSLIVSSFSQIH
jgi:hypothetical protein